MNLLAGGSSRLESILAQSGDAEHSLKRTLGPFSLVALGIGAVIGAGIFTLTGQAAGDHAGPAIVISFIIAAMSRICWALL